MRSSGVREGTRAAILAELDQYGEDRFQAGKEDRAREIARAWHLINDGDADEVQIGHLVYRVTDVSSPE